MVWRRTELLVRISQGSFLDIIRCTKYWKERGILKDQQHSLENPGFLAVRDGNCIEWTVECHGLFQSHIYFSMIVTECCSAQAGRHFQACQNVKSTFLGVPIQQRHHSRNYVGVGG